MIAIDNGSELTSPVVLGRTSRTGVDWLVADAERDR